LMSTGFSWRSPERLPKSHGRNQPLQPRRSRRLQRRIRDVAMESLIPLVLNALTLISILMLVGLGLAIIFGLMNVINLAHGEFVTIGAYTLAFVESLSGSFWLALALAPIVGGAVGLLVERMMIRHLYTRPLATILATWGLSLVLQQLLQLGFGAAPQRVDGPLPGSAFVFGVA